jgi:hypothetical protein
MHPPKQLLLLYFPPLILAQERGPGSAGEKGEGPVPDWNNILAVFPLSKYF